MVRKYIKNAKLMECDVFSAQLSLWPSSFSVDICLALSLKYTVCVLVEMF